jgi:HK97 family phage prohead protease
MDTLGVLCGHYAVFGEWIEVDSYEGRFLESIAPGAFRQTMVMNRRGVRCLFQHGADSRVGLKPLGVVRTMHEDDTGAWYEVDLLDVDYVRSLIPGLRAGLYGASFRFRVVREQVNAAPQKSEWNPLGLQERIIMEAQTREFGPVTWPAYPSATAALTSQARSASDQLEQRSAGYLPGTSSFSSELRRREAQRRERR